MGKNGKGNTRKGDAGKGKGMPAWAILLLLLLIVGGGFILVNWFFLHLWGWGLPSGCNCCGCVNASVSRDFTLTVNGTEVADAYVGDIYLEYMAFSNEFYQFMLAHPEFTTVDDIIAYFNTTYGLDDPYTSYMAWGDIEFEDIRAIFDSDYDNISINGESFSACITGVAFIPYISIEVYYANGTFYDYFDFALMTAAELLELTDLDDPLDLLNHLPERLIVECGETLSFTILDVVWDEDEIVVDVTVDGVNLECPEVDYWPF